MVSRIEVIPSEVRGYGNIVMAKSLSDFVPVESDLVYSENVYSLTAVSGVHISLTASSSSIDVGSSVTLSATVMDDDTPVSGVSVSFYDGTTSLGTGTTNSSGVATYTTSSLSVGSHSLSAVYDDKTSNLVNVTVNKITSTLSISVSSSSISYGDSVTISGTLSVGSGESVKVYQGNTLLDTVTTSTGGAYSKTVSGLSVGAYSFHTVYDGDSTHSEVVSSNVSVTVNKLTPTITLSVPSTGTVGTSYSITGTLVPTSGSVKLYENGSLKDTLTVSSGSFSKSVTQNSEGTYSYYAVFEGSSTYESVTSSTGSIVVSDVPTPSYDGVSLTSDKSILSYADSESATLTAQLLDGSSSASVSGVTVEFFKGSTSLGTATTNSSGVATKSYSSTGAGDISLTASAGTFVSEIYSVVDADYYNPTGVSFTSSSSTDRKEQSGITYTYNTPSKFEVSYDYTITSGQNLRWYFISNPTGSSNQYGIGFQKYANVNKGVVTVRTTSSSNVDNVGSISIGQTVNIRIIRDNNTFKVYVGETLATTQTITWWDSHKPYGFAWGIWGTGAAKIENIIVKPL